MNNFKSRLIVEFLKLYALGLISFNFTYFLTVKNKSDFLLILTNVFIVVFSFLSAYRNAFYEINKFNLNEDSHIEITYQVKNEIRIITIKPSLNYKTKLKRHGWGFNPSVNWLVLYYNGKILLKQRPSKNWSESELVRIHEESEKWRTNYG